MNHNDTCGDSWVVQIKNDLDNYDPQARAAEERRKIFRVPTSLMKAKPSEFEPQFISFGLFDRQLNLENSQVYKVRLELARALLSCVDNRLLRSPRHLPASEQWNSVCREVVPDPKAIREIYDEPSSLTDPEIQFFLTSDALLLTSLYIDQLFPKAYPLLSKATRKISEDVQSDIMLLQNQIPLFLVGNVLKILCGSNPEMVKRDLQSLRKEIVLKYSYSGSIPGSGRFYTHMEAASESLSGLDGYHPLECLYNAICQDENRAEEWTEDNGGYVAVPTASQLKTVGIKLVGGDKSIAEVEFKSGYFGATLHLPELALDTSTEMLWRNLLAYESSRESQESQFLCYLELMSDLISSKDDVRLMRQPINPVISQSHLGSEKDVAMLFASILKSCRKKRSEKWTRLREDINRYYRREFNKKFVEFKESHLSKPWVILSVAAAVILLVSGIIQAVYTVLGYYFHP